MVLVEAVIVLGVAGLVIYGLLSLALNGTDPNTRRREQTPSPVAAHWRTAHYEAADATMVVVHRVTADGTVLDEHLVATVAREDPDYETAFLEAMARARQRVALFESEES